MSRTLNQLAITNYELQILFNVSYILKETYTSDRQPEISSFFIINKFHKNFIKLANFFTPFTQYDIL
jgi:hypothetical protein